MKSKIVVHEAEEDGYWAVVPSIPGRVTQGDSMWKHFVAWECGVGLSADII